MHDITTGILTSHNWFYLQCAVYRDWNLKNQVRSNVRMVPTPTQKDRTNFPSYKMTTLEIRSIVASSQNYNWQWIIKDKTQTKLLSTWMPQSFLCYKRKAGETLFGTDASAGSLEAWSFRLLDPKAWEQTSSPRRILIYYQKQGPYGPQGK